MTGANIQYEKAHKRLAMAVSIVLHTTLILFILFWPTLKYVFPPPGKEGILVVFGETPESQNLPQDNAAPPKNAQKQQKENKKETKQEIEKNVKQITDEKNKNFQINEKNIEKKQTKQQHRENQQQDNIAKAKDEFSKLFNSRGTKKKGNGLQGDPLGERDAQILEGITRGKGKVGSGLDSRGILYEPSFDDTSQKSGRVVVKICIDQTGKVISARYTQRGSTTTDSELIDLAVANAKKYRFTPSNKEKQCGTIIIDFIVK